MGRKTIEVGKLLKMADEREAICSFIEAALFESGNYEGFRYLEQEHHADGTLKTLGCGSRRFYFVSKDVQEDYAAEDRDINKIRI
jgi:hypothetical protein